MTSRNSTMLGFGLALMTVSLSGCGGPTARQADPNLARDTLHRALDAWKAGTSHEEFQKQAPSLTVVEPRWQQGGRLVDYEVRGDGKPDGFDHQFAVQLSLEEAGKKQRSRSAVYNVSTSPALVIVAVDEDK